MNRIDVEIIELKIIKKNQLLLWIKLEKNGRVFRQGTGQFPPIQTQVDALFGHILWFHSVLKLLPDNVFQTLIIPQKPQFHKAPVVEYQLKFYKANDPLPHSGLHVELTTDQELEHPLLPLIEQVRMEALSLTENMYFDALIYAAKGYKSNWLPLDCKINGPANEMDTELTQYLKYLIKRQGQAKLHQFAVNKFYTAADVDYVLRIQNENLEFVAPKIRNQRIPPSQKEKSKPWWHFWK